MQAELIICKQTEQTIKDIICESVEDLGRPDLFREPIVAFASAHDPRFSQLQEWVGPWHNLPQDLLPGAESVISYFVPYTKEVSVEPRKSKHGSPLWSEAYLVVNEGFLTVNERVIAYLEKLGFAATAIRPTHTYDPEDLQCFWSHRSTAVIAGLGQMAANRLVITEKGSCGRFCTVITTAPLIPNENPYPQKCRFLIDGSCGACFKVCPAGALKADSLDKFACQEELFRNQEIMEQETGMREADTCGKCLSICPFAYVA